MLPSSPWCGHLSSIRWTVPVLIIQFSPPSCPFITLISQLFPNTLSVFLLSCKGRTQLLSLVFWSSWSPVTYISGYTVCIQVQRHGRPVAKIHSMCSPSLSGRDCTVAVCSYISPSSAPIFCGAQTDEICADIEVCSHFIIHNLP